MNLSLTKNTIFFCLAIFALFVSALISIFWGGSDLSFQEILHAFINPQDDNAASTILWNIRIPRMLLAMLVGAGLSVSGCVFQGILRNPLAEPYTLGIAGGASFGVCIASLFGLSMISQLPAACIGGIAAVVAVYILAARRDFSPLHLLLSGIIINVLTSSAIVFMISLADITKLPSTMRWLMGSLSTVSLSTLILPFILISICISVIIFLSGRIDIISLGTERATELGVNSGNTIKILFLIASLITGICVAYAGIIAFIGIIIPHIVRYIIGPMHRMLIVFSIIFGSAFLCLADTLSRTIIYPIELPVGVISGIIGSVFFISMLIHSKEWNRSN